MRRLCELVPEKSHNNKRKMTNPYTDNGDCMKQFDLEAPGVKLILEKNVLAVLSDSPLNTISSAFHNGGGIKKTNAILNVEVLKSYSDRTLHDDPEAYIMESSKVIGLNESFIGMVTAAAVENFSMVSKREEDLGVNVIATAADNEGHTCNHAESAGEKIEVKVIEGTINIIAVVDGNPTESCLAGLIITITEAKMAALRELDIRSRYSGDQATGTITDSVVVAETNRGTPLVYGGPASKLGQLVGYCTKEAVKEAVMKASECMPGRSLISRLRERNLSIEKLASELSKSETLNLDKKTLEYYIERTLRTKPEAAWILMAAAKMDEEVKNNLIPLEFGRIEAASRKFGELVLHIKMQSSGKSDVSENDEINLSPFLKQVLVNMVREAWNESKTESLK